MSTITASDVNKLRQQTGSGMMDCKKALVEAEGNFEKAVEILRKKGQKVAANREDRDASEGIAIAKTTSDGSRGVVVVVNCETDFVAKNEDFSNFVSNIVEAAIKNNPKTTEELASLSYSGNGLTIADKIIEQIGKIGEKIEISKYEVIEAAKVVAYNHPGNKIASLVGLDKAIETADQIGRDVAMQVAAMAPLALDKDGVSKETIEKEIEIGKELAIKEGKPAEMAEKIALGKLNKFYQENTLLNQDFIKENKKSVAQYLKENGDLKVTAFKRASLM
jgi:elongation factor Ts